MGLLRSARSLDGLLMASLLFLAGCGRACGPEVFPTTLIRGRIHLDDRPIGPGWLEIVPIEGTLGRLCSAPLAKDGTFSATKVPVGRVAIRLVVPPLQRTGDSRMDQFLFQARRMALIHRTVAASNDARLDLDLRAEMAEFERRYPSYLQTSHSP